MMSPKRKFCVAWTQPYSLMSHDFETEQPDVRTRARSVATCNRSYHAVFLGVSVLFIVMAYLLVIVSDDRVAVRGFEDRPLPRSCTFRMLFGIDCPGCGLTRGTLHFANGRFAESFAMHHLAWMIALLVVAQIPYRLVCIVRGNPAPLGRRVPVIVVWSLLVLMAGNWLLGFLIGG